MKINDKRITSSWIPAVSILEEIIPHIKNSYLVGIRSIILLDKDYHQDKKTKALGRYAPIPGSNSANIEIYLESLSSMPDLAKNSRMYLSYLISRILMHEIYHHIVRGQGIKQMQRFKVEEGAADKWSLREVDSFFEKLFPADEYEEEWNNIHEAKRRAGLS
ncbi:MAG: hypothetical protein SWO11_17645 [Thermodesulfobacteriota bacterium]|nr:hypothetical protein [Thermodesulfobacteriota bacterium]